MTASDPDVEHPVPKRRKYTKVRNGCLTCKERRVRCTLERPTCQNCERLSRECAYAGQKANLRHLSTQIEELDLMHHYTAFTCLTVSKIAVLSTLWKDIIPKHAFRHPFLLRALLAFAAQHKIYLSDGSQELINLAEAYYQESLPEYIRMLNDVTESNCHALFAYSQIIVAIAYDRLNRDYAREAIPSSAFISGIIDIFELLKGALAVAEHASRWLYAGDLAPMMGGTPDALLSERSRTRNVYVGALSALKTHITEKADSTQQSGVRLNSILSTIELMHKILCEEVNTKTYMHLVIGLPMWLDTKYIQLLKVQRDDAALAVLAYYAVAVHRIHDFWSFEGVGHALVKAIEATISKEWAPYLSWPKIEVQK